MRVLPWCGLFFGIGLASARTASLVADDSTANNLGEVGRIATAMLDGDLCARIDTARSAEYAMKRDPRDPWRAADNYDVNFEPFIAVKKVLIRLANLCRETCDVNLWKPVAATPGRVQIVIRNVHELSQFWTWGEMQQAMPDEMQRVFEHAKSITVRHRPGMTSVLAPVFNSVGRVVAIAEVVSDQNPDRRENVK